MANDIEELRFNGTRYGINDERLANKANIDGAYEGMTVGDAEQLVSTRYVNDAEPYNFRTTGGSADVGNRKYLDKIVGGTVAWNQLAPEADFSTHNHWWKGNGCDSVTFNNGIATVVTLQDPASATIYNRLVDCDGIGYVKDHAYLAYYEYKLDAQIPSGIVPRATIQTYMPMFTTQGKDVTSNNWETFARVFKATDSSGTSSVLTRFRIDMGVSYTDSYEYQLRRPQVFDLTQMFGTTVADYIYSLEQANAGAGVAWFKKLFPKPYYAYNAGELMSVQAVSHDTVGFNAWDEEWELGALSATGNNATSSTEIRSKNYIPVVGGQTYYLYCAVAGTFNYKFYDADKNFISGSYIGRNNTLTIPNGARYMRFYMGAAYGTTYKNDICINLSWDGERDGEYEEYVKHEYALDSDLELRGIPKLDASNNLYYDGDTYESDGTVTRKYGIVDLGTLTWIKNTNWNGSPGFYIDTKIPDIYIPTSGADSTKGDMLCSRYEVKTRDYLYVHYDENGICLPNGGLISVRDSAYANYTAGQFKTAMSGVYLVYELAEPTTEEADPYQNPQIVDDFGTEEYVDAGVTASTPTRDVAIPVGHNTKYQPNLRAKLEMLPNSPDGDGDYLMRQANGENSFVPFVKELPALPSEDGTYVLKCTVSGSTKTLGWVEEE